MSINNRGTVSALVFIATPALLAGALTLMSTLAPVSAQAATVAAPASTPLGSLTASPNPCISSDGIHCATQVTWTPTAAGTGVNVIIFVNSTNTGATKSFVCNAGQFTADAPWIPLSTGPNGDVLEFSVYQTASCAITSPAGLGQPLASVSVTGLNAPPTMPPHAVGAVIWNLRNLYFGELSPNIPPSNPAYMTLGRRWANKMLTDAQVAGVTFARVDMSSATPYVPGQASDLYEWETNPEAYWENVDQMMNDLDAHHIRLVPSFYVDPAVFAVLANDGETYRDTMTNPQSKSYQLLQKYISDFITRYKNRNTVYFYQILGETNLAADLDDVASCQQQNPGNSMCQFYGNFSTNDLISFSTRLASYIRTLDPSRPISSSYAIPRAAAEHLRAQPQWSPQGPDWRADTQAQFVKNLTDINQGFDIIDSHFYNDCDANGFCSNQRFGITGSTNADLLDIINAAVVSVHKSLYISEFADVPANSTTPFANNMLAKMVQDGVAYASPWVWEMYDRPYQTRPEDSQDGETFLSPGYTDAFIATMKATNQALGAPYYPPVSDKPGTIITWPIMGDTLQTPYEVYAVASGPQSITKVDFLLDGGILSSLSSPPYTASLDPNVLMSGSHVLIVRATDASGAVASDSLAIINGVVQTPPTTASTPTCTLSVSPTTILPGSSAMLTWTSINATSGTIDGIGNVALSGSQMVSPAQTITYTATFTGASGSVTCTATLTVSSGTQNNAPTCTLSVSPTTILPGSSAMLTWTSTNASDSSITNVGTGVLSGSSVVYPSQTTTYIGTFTGAGGLTVCTATVTVAQTVHTGLTSAQISAVIPLFQSFGVSNTTLAQIQAILY